MKDNVRKVIVDGHDVQEKYTIRKSAIERMKLKPASTLKGLGCGSCVTVGKRILTFVLGGVCVETEILVVPDDVQDNDMIIEGSAISQPGVKVVGRPSRKKRLKKRTLTKYVN